MKKRYDVVGVILDNSQYLDRIFKSDAVEYFKAAVNVAECAGNLVKKGGKKNIAYARKLLKFASEELADTAIKMDETNKEYKIQKGLWGRVLNCWYKQTKNGVTGAQIFGHGIDDSVKKQYNNSVAKTGYADMSKSLELVK